MKMIDNLKQSFLSFKICLRKQQIIVAVSMVRNKSCNNLKETLNYLRMVYMSLYLLLDYII